jgi:hypothetical protein
MMFFVATKKDYGPSLKIIIDFQVETWYYVFCSNDFKGGLAQLGEHLPYKQGVGGSIPSSSTINMNTMPV